MGSSQALQPMVSLLHSRRLIVRYGSVGFVVKTLEQFQTCIQCSASMFVATSLAVDVAKLIRFVYNVCADELSDFVSRYDIIKISLAFRQDLDKCLAKASASFEIELHAKLRDLGLIDTHYNRI